MRVLVTRPAADGHRTAAALARLGHEAIEAPLTRIEYRRPDLPGEGVEALVATSPHAFEGLADAPPAALAGLPLYCVGVRALEAARAHGFAPEPPAEPDVRHLVERLSHTTHHCFLYLAGRNRKPALEDGLASAGRKVETAVLYEAVAEARLPEAAHRRIAAGEIDAVLHYSQRHAALFFELAEAGGLGSQVAGLRHVCLSADVAGVLRGITDNLRIAREPTEAALLEALERP